MYLLVLLGVALVAQPVPPLETPGGGPKAPIIWQTNGGGKSQGGGYHLEVSFGAPQPYGIAQGSGYRVTLGPRPIDPTRLDRDGDGYTTGYGDCNDGDPSIYPGAPELCDLVDQDCDGDLVEGFVDTDLDGEPDCVDADDDGDGILDDGDASGIAGDNRCTGVATTGCDDNCPLLHNPSQADNDGDHQGDGCDVCPYDPDDDLDGDGVCGDVDNCPDVSNPEQANQDNDGYGDLCESSPAAMADPNIHPGAVELCDGIDNDEDGSVDEGTGCEVCQ